MATAQLQQESIAPDQAALGALPDHRHQPRANPVDFLAPPPAEIGPLSSAESTLRAGRKPIPLILRLLMGTAFAGAIVYAFSWATEGTRRQDRESLMILGFVFAFIAFALDMYLTRFNAVITYVGRDGVTRHKVRGHRNAFPKTQTLLFAQVDSLRAAQTRQFVNGVYT